MIVTVDDLQKRALFFAVILLWLLVPLIAVVGFALGNGGLFEAGFLAAIAGLVTFERWRLGSAMGVQMAASAGLALSVATIVYLMRGHAWQADNHMIFFAALALTAVFCDWRPIVTFAAVIAVHHLVLNFTFTAAVFPGQASLGRVMLHAAVLLVQTVPLIWLAMTLARMFERSDHLVGQATASQQQAMEFALLQKEERERLGNVVEALGAGLRELAKGNLSRPIQEPFGGGLDALRVDFNDALMNLDTTLRRVVETSRQIRSSSTELSEASEELARRTENQAAALEETAAALDEMTSSVKSTAEGALNVEAIVRRTKQQADESAMVVGAAVAAMSEIEKSSQQISQIIGSIDDIAFQTNLLALNAGVEAARAGESGKGFAVVASEVRTLALRSSAAAMEIKALITTAAGHVDHGVDQVGKAGAALNDIFASVVQISSLVSTIAGAAGEQSTGLAEINVGMIQLDTVTQQNAAMAVKSTDSNKSLRTDAEGLATIVSHFTLRQTVAREKDIGWPSLRPAEADPSVVSARSRAVQPTPLGKAAGW